MWLIVIGIVMALLVVWSKSIRRRLVAMDENVANAMGQIGVQLSARYDAMNALLDFVKGYSSCEAQPLLEILKGNRIIITAISTPQEVQNQEKVISEVLERVVSMAENYPELKGNEEYGKYLSAVDSYGKMVCTSRLIYNDSVMRLNRELRIFPISVVGGVFGFRERTYLETI